MHATQDVVSELMILVKEKAKTHDLNSLVQVDSLHMFLNRYLGEVEAKFDHAPFLYLFPFMSQK